MTGQTDTSPADADDGTGESRDDAAGSLLAGDRGTETHTICGYVATARLDTQSQRETTAGMECADRAKLRVYLTACPRGQARQLRKREHIQRGAAVTRDTVPHRSHASCRSESTPRATDAKSSTATLDRSTFNGRCEYAFAANRRTGPTACTSTANSCHSISSDLAAASLASNCTRTCSKRYKSARRRQTLKRHNSLHAYHRDVELHLGKCDRSLGNARVSGVQALDARTTLHNR
jgi:hypothetical protein